MWAIELKQLRKINFEAPVVFSGASKFCVRHDRAITQQFWISGTYAFSPARPLPETVKTPASLLGLLMGWGEGRFVKKDGATASNIARTFEFPSGQDRTTLIIDISVGPAVDIGRSGCRSSLTRCK